MGDVSQPLTNSEIVALTAARKVGLVVETCFLISSKLI